MRALKEKISITIDGDLLEKLRLRAEEDDRSLSQYINMVLKEHLKKTEKLKKQNRAVTKYCHSPFTMVGTCHTVHILFPLVPFWFL